MWGGWTSACSDVSFTPTCCDFDVAVVAKVLVERWTTALGCKWLVTGAQGGGLEALTGGAFLDIVALCPTWGAMPSITPLAPLAGGKAVEGDLDGACCDTNDATG